MMGWGNIGTGGQISLRVVTSKVQPAAAVENTIWVNTEKAVPEWTVSPSAPENPKDGTVWIMNSVPSKASFNLLHRNQLIVHISNVQIFENSKWRNISASIYQAGKWISVSKMWNGELYIKGDEFIDVTGGWKAIGFPSYPEDPSGTPTLRKGDQQMIFNADGGCILYTQKKIRLDGYKKLHFIGSFDSPNNGWQWLRIWSRLSGDAGKHVVREAGGYDEGPVDLTVDITGLTGEYIVGISNYEGPVTVEKIYME